MKRSTDRILTTHSGSMPRPQAVQEMMRARQRRESIDEQAFNGRVREAVAEAVRGQAKAGTTSSAPRAMAAPSAASE